jgi:hypothetical protein
MSGWRRKALNDRFRLSLRAVTELRRYVGCILEPVDRNTILLIG